MDPKLNCEMFGNVDSHINIKDYSVQNGVRSIVPVTNDSGGKSLRPVDRKFNVKPTLSQRQTAVSWFMYSIIFVENSNCFFFLLCHCSSTHDLSVPLSLLVVFNNGNLHLNSDFFPGISKIFLEAWVYYIICNTIESHLKLVAQGNEKTRSKGKLKF